MLAIFLIMGDTRQRFVQRNETTAVHAFTFLSKGNDMSLIPQQDQTVSAIYKAIEGNHNERPRKYLGASAIGKSCARALWMDFRMVKSQDFTGPQLRLFNTGHL